jgi:hypothetical protein
MFENILLQFIVELLRTLLADELSGHVRKRIRRFVARRNRSGRAFARVQRRTGDRLLNRLFTELEDEP